MYVILGVNVRFCCGITSCYSHHRGHVLEVVIVVHLDFAQATVRMSDLNDHRKSTAGQLKTIPSIILLQILPNMIYVINKTHHFFVIRIECLFDQRKVLLAQPSLYLKQMTENPRLVLKSTETAQIYSPCSIVYDNLTTHKHNCRI